MSTQQITSTQQIASTQQIVSTQQIASMSGDNSKGVSLCIPRVFNNIGWRRIKRVFIALNWGFVERVDVIPSGGTKRAFVHFAPGKFTAGTVLAALCEGKQVRIVYDEPWFWNISLSRSKKPDEAPKPAQRPQVQITAPSAVMKNANNSNFVIGDIAQFRWAENGEIGEGKIIKIQQDKFKMELTKNYGNIFGPSGTFINKNGVTKTKDPIFSAYKSNCWRKEESMPDYYRHPRRSKKTDEAPKPVQCPALTRQTADMTDEHEESKVGDSRGAVNLALGEDFGQCSIDSHYSD